jgi:colicin import membrane protein
MTTNSSGSYFFPVVISVFFHIMIVGLVVWGWESASDKTSQVTPRYIEAKLITMKATHTKPKKIKSSKVINLDAKRKKEAKRLAQEKKKQAALKAKQAKQKALDKSKAEKLKQKKLIDQELLKREEAKQQEKIEQERIGKERVEREDAFSKALANEEAELQEQYDIEQAQSYIGVIAALIEQNWSRPPSARRGMQCELIIQLIPTGEVINVSIVSSSGNSAFDRSAEQAVKRAGRFDVLKDVDPVMFDRYFRQLRLRFNPQDLRL